MENPVDHTVDLGLVNYVKHPSNPNYIVYRFADIDRANSFEQELKLKDIWYEKGEDNKRGKLYTLYGVHKNDFKTTEKINYKVEAKHKKPFIPFKILRIVLMLFSATVLTIAILGYCEHQKKLASINSSSQTINTNE